MRYEIAIAAIFCRLGFLIEFLDHGNPQAPHCEFIATHPEKKIRIAIEAKSRARKGVIHQPGSSTENELMKLDVRSRIKDAIKQRPSGMSFMIFIDINSPLTPGVAFPEKPWFTEIERNIEGVFGKPSENDTSPVNAVFFTNFSFHYQTEHEASPEEHVSVWFRSTENPLPDFEIFGLLKSGLDHYGNVPDLE